VAHQPLSEALPLKDTMRCKKKPEGTNQALAEFKQSMKRLRVMSQASEIRWPHGVWLALQRLHYYRGIPIPKKIRVLCKRPAEFEQWWHKYSIEINLLAAIDPSEWPKEPPSQRLIAAPVATPEQTANFYACRAWRELRYKILKEQGARCACCGRGREHNVALHVDHIKPMYTHPELKLDPSNLQVLCEDCNLGKSCHDSTDWRTTPQQKAASPRT
jgi:hypothetical protein